MSRNSRRRAELDTSHITKKPGSAKDEAAEAARLFRKHDKDGSGHIDTGEFRKMGALMNSQVDQIDGIVTQLRNNLKRLGREMKSDASGLDDYKRTLDLMQAKRDDLSAELKEHTDYIHKYDTDLAPFMNAYKSNTGDVVDIYKRVKESHKKGIASLEEHFDYHPLWKRDTDYFSATPFVPK